MINVASKSMTSGCLALAAWSGGVLAGQRPCPGASSLARRVDRCDRPDGVGGERGDQAGHGRIRRDKPEHARLAPQRVDIGERVTTQSERDREIRDNFARIMCRERFPPRRQRVRQRQVEACRAHRFREQDTARLPDRGDSRGVDANSWVRSGILHLEGAPFVDNEALRQAQLSQIRGTFLTPPRTSTTRTVKPRG
ncbi:hypothetical protein FHX72_001669 [Pseudoclavibacter helvolus]|uniref:Uncharacterized protein n=1 Tax=Pseudoclavibacter helvolus TaxID=255205 RepID=A0A7W4UN64_9MICO|nr:hypothetical protein [Pseudoclavibacter helvolus]